LDIATHIAATAHLIRDLAHTVTDIKDQEILNILTQLLTVESDTERLSAASMGTLTRTAGRPPTEREMADADRELDRLSALLMLIRLDIRLSKRSMFGRMRIRAETRQIEELRQQYHDLYVALAILEERIAGNLPATEGILLMRERV